MKKIDRHHFGINTMKIETAFICIGVVAIGLVKISVVLLYRRIFDRPRSFRILLSFWTVVLLLWPAVFTIAGLLQCGRDLKATLSSHKDYFGDCENVVPIGYALVVSDVATNLVTLLLPLPMVCEPMLRSCYSVGSISQ